MRLGLSLKSQEVTAIFLAVRLICSVTMEGDIHTILDFATLVSTLWVIYMIRYKLKASYIKTIDTCYNYYVVMLWFKRVWQCCLFLDSKYHVSRFFAYQLVPSAILALVVNPSTSYSYVHRIMWAFCVYTESVSVLPQLRLMQNAQVSRFWHIYVSFDCFCQVRFSILTNYDGLVVEYSSCWSSGSSLIHVGQCKHL